LASEEEVVDASPEFGQVLSGVGSLALLPLSAGDRRLGGIGLCRERSGGFSADERGEALAIVTLGAQALERALRYEIAQQVAATLSVSLQPSVPEVPGITVYSCYLPAATDAQVGGDWYDVIRLNAGRVGLVVGDVAGQGVRAAAVMGQLRTGLRAYLREGHEPGAALRLTDLLTSELSPTLMTTVWCGVLDPASGRLSYSNGGHLPPAVIDVTGAVSFVDGARNPPLGVRWNGDFSQAEAEIERRAFMVCYTDGLIERPGEQLDDGLQRLADALEQSFAGLDELGSRLLALPIETHIDDVAVLAIYRDPLAGEEGDASA
jgi:serine phosphatase RsbU (regulator of sigma subunit)